MSDQTSQNEGSSFGEFIGQGVFLVLLALFNLLAAHWQQPPLRNACYLIAAGFTYLAIVNFGLALRKKRGIDLGLPPPLALRITGVALFAVLSYGLLTLPNRTLPLQLLMLFGLSVLWSGVVALLIGFAKQDRARKSAATDRR